MVTSIGYQLQKNRRITSLGFQPCRVVGKLVRHGGTALVNRLADAISGDGWKLTGGIIFQQMPYQSVLSCRFPPNTMAVISRWQ